MEQRLASFIAADHPAVRRLKLDTLGPVVSELPDLYHLVSEQRLDLLLVDGARNDMTQSVAIRLRRRNGLMEIWRLMADSEFVGAEGNYCDGWLSLQ
ncbi:MAG: hypothetical protein D6800_06545, partial [Candidatus Zixiibacteriota bacterium]